MQCCDSNTSEMKRSGIELGSVAERTRDEASRKGCETKKDTLTASEKGGVVCQTGILGGVYALNGFDPIKDIPNGVYLTGFYSNSSTQEMVDSMFGFLKEKNLTPVSGKVFAFEEIRDAVLAQDTDYCKTLTDLRRTDDFRYFKKKIRRISDG